MSLFESSRGVAIQDRQPCVPEACHTIPITLRFSLALVSSSKAASFGFPGFPWPPTAPLSWVQRQHALFLAECGPHPPVCSLAALAMGELLPGTEQGWGRFPPFSCPGVSSHWPGPLSLLQAACEEVRREHGERGRLHTSAGRGAQSPAQGKCD